MKKLGYLTYAALLAFASCTNEINEEGFVDKANTISFSAYPNKTRAVTGDVTSENLKGDNFGVFGYYNNSPYLFKTEGETKKAVEQTWKSSSEGNNGSWEYQTSSELKFWPNGSMDFYAYFPYSDNATFVESIASGENETSADVMTISGTSCAHDVLFAKKSTSIVERVPLTFHHAFSRIKGLNIKVNGGNVGEAEVEVTVKEIEFINTSTSGDIKVNAEGNASYTIASTNVPVKKTFDANTTISKSLQDGENLISDTDYKYLFATNSSVTNSVIGTAKTMWDGTKTSLTEGKTLETLGQVCLKLTCKVKDNTHYIVGDANTDGVVYIPLTGTHSNQNSVTTFDAGKRYTYNIVFSHNVGFDVNGDPILNPILFNVSTVDTWEDVNVTITL